MIYTIEELLKLLVAKKPPSKLGLRRRHTESYKLTANDRVVAEKSVKKINFVLQMNLFLPKGGKINDFLRLLIGRHITLTHTIERGLGECRPNRHRTIDNWIHEEAPMDFRFTQDQLKILSKELGRYSARFLQWLEIDPRHQASDHRERIWLLRRSSRT